MSYTGWQEVTIVWLDGTEEKISVVGYAPAEVSNGILHLRISERDEFRHIPLSSLREWRGGNY